MLGLSVVFRSTMISPNDKSTSMYNTEKWLALR